MTSRSYLTGMAQRSLLSSSYVPLPSLLSSNGAAGLGASQSTYAPPIVKDQHTRPFLPPLDEEARQSTRSLAVWPSSRPSSSSTSRSRPVSSQCSTPAASTLRSSLSTPHSRGQSRQGKCATFADELPSLNGESREEQTRDSSDDFASSRGSRSSASNEEDSADRLLSQAAAVLAEESETEQHDSLAQRRQRAGILAQLKRADRERVDMARELYDEVQMAMEEVAKEEEQRRSRERDESERTEERKRVKDEKRREKREADLIETLSAQQLLHILDCFPPTAAHTTPPRPATAARSYNLQLFVNQHHSLHHLMFRNAPSSCAEAAVVSVEWCAPPSFHHVLTRHLSPNQLPAYLHADLDMLDPSSSALLAFLSSWLRSYTSERSSFSSLSNFLTLKLSELSAATARLSSPNSLLTFISVDAMLQYISSLPAEQVRLQVLLTLMLDMLLLAVYTKQSDTGSGRLRVRDESYSTRVRTLDALLDERREEHSRMARRMQSMHDQRVKVLQMWQPAVSRAISRWQLPIKALTFQCWLASHHKRRWRLSDGQRSLSTLVRTLRRRWDMRHNMRVGFLSWREQALSTRLTRLQDELATLARINGDKHHTLQRLAASSTQYSDQCQQREKEVEEGVLRTEMMKVQHSEYEEMLAVYGVQEEEAARLVELFGALMLRGVEEFEVQAAQMHYGHWHDIEQLGDIEPLQDSSTDGEITGALTGGSDAGSAAEKRKKSRQLLASLVNKKKASSASRRGKKDAEQGDSRSFLRVWTAHQYRRFAHVFADSALSTAAVPLLSDTEVVLSSLAPSQPRYQSLIAPSAPNAFASSVELEAGARLQSAASKRRSTNAATGGGLEVAASFLNALRSLEHTPFPFAPFSSPDAYLAHHSHPPIRCADQADMDDRQLEEREDTRRRLRQATDSMQVLPHGAVSPEMEYLLSLSYADGQQALPSLFSFMPDMLFPLPLPHPLLTPYALPFAQPAPVRAPHYIVQAIIALPALCPPADSNTTSSTSAHSSASVSLKAAVKCDMELFHASCLSLLYSYPCLPFDWDDEQCQLSELTTLALSLATSPRQQLMRLHSDVMRVVLQLMRAWRKRMKQRRQELCSGQRQFVAHVQRAEEEVSKRLMRKIREREAVSRVLQPQVDKEAEAGIVAVGRSGGSSLVAGEAAPLGRVEDAFGAVEEETVVELALDTDDTDGAPNGRKANNKKRKDRHGKKAQPHTQPTDTRDQPATAPSAATTTTAANTATSAAHKGGQEYDAEKAQDEAESAELRYDGERLREVCQQCIDRIKAKAAEEREKRDRKSKKKRDSVTSTQPATEGDTSKEAVSSEGEAADVLDVSGTEKEGAAAVGDDEEDVALFGDEDESAQCEEAVLKYIADIRRLYRNSCETEDAQPSAASPPKPLPPSTSATSAKLSAGAAAGVSAPMWCMSRVHLGRLVRKYKLLGKTCSAQFVDQLWDDKQASKRNASLTAAATSADGSEAAVAPAALEGDGWVNFDDFLELLLRIATHKYSSTAPTLTGRLSSLLSLDLFPSLSRPSPLADFRTSIALTCEPTFDKHNKFLSAVFRAYSSDRESNGGVQEPAMTRRDFDEFIEGTGLVQRKVIAVRTVAVLWGSAQMDDDEAGSGGGAAGADLFGGSSSMVFWEFLESVAAMACFYDRDPFLPVETRLDAFIDYLQDGCPPVETKRRMYTAKVQGGGGSGAVGTAAVKGKAAETGSNDTPTDSPAATRPSTASKR